MSGQPASNHLTCGRFNVAFHTIGEGTPFVLLHGFQATSRIYFPIMKRLARFGLRVIAPDLPHHGKTWGWQADAEMADYAKVVWQLLDQLGVKQAIIGGHSMGGRVAVERRLWNRIGRSCSCRSTPFAVSHGTR